MALKLTLKPNEKIVVNGAVLTNGPAKTTIAVENSAVILRQKDVMQETEANTPARRIYYTIQLAYLDDDNRLAYLGKTNLLARDFVSAAPTPEVIDTVVSLGADLARGNFFQALKRCKKLIAYEETRLNYGREPIR